jgi:serine/threonine-protein kinase ATR
LPLPLDGYNYSSSRTARVQEIFSDHYSPSILQCLDKRRKFCSKMTRVLNGNGEPPPSTLAAQIVQNFETSDKRPKGNARVHLQELLHMILEGDEDDVASQRAFDDTLEENYRLISVITKACIEPLLSENPFDEQESLRSQARDSLAVVDLTIRRSPDVLFLVPPGRSVTSSPNGPLFLWLIPHLINVITTNDETITDGVQKVVQSVLWAQRRPCAYRHGRQCVLRYLQGCVRGKL